MRTSRILIGALVFFSAAAVGNQAAGAPDQETPPQTQPGGTPSAPAPAPAGTVQEINDRFAQKIAQSIAGREKEPAEQVFKNIQWLKGVPAGRLLMIMNVGYSRSLGVSCTHCHVEEDFASDDKRPKRAAREMQALHRSINEQLGKLKELEPKPQPRGINCTTCHRGAIDPMTGAR